MSTDSNTNIKTVKVWDPLVRVFHWGVVGAFLIAFLTSEDNFADLHVVAGYTILGLVAIRLLWGVFGTRHARFANFVASPAEVRDYLKRMVAMKAPSHVGHNPAAGYMIIALLVGLVLTGLTGMAVYGAEENAGPLAGMMASLGAFGGDLFEEVHEVIAFTTLGLAGFHVAGVLFSSWLHDENLIRAMVTGEKEVHADAIDLDHTAPDTDPVPGMDGAPVAAGSALRRAATVIIVPIAALLIGAVVVGAADISANGAAIHADDHDDDD